VKQDIGADELVKPVSADGFNVGVIDGWSAISP
jgi:hypothetical protein